MARAVLRPKGQARGRRPLPTTKATSWSRSRSSRVMPRSSARRMPVSANKRMIASSRTPLEVAGARGEQSPELVLGEHGHGLLGDVWGPHAGHGVGVEPPFEDR